MSDETSRYVRTAMRPLELALALRSAAPLIHLLDGKPAEVENGSLRRNFAGAVPVALDQVSDWWDSLGADSWPDDRLEPMGRLPWPKVWAEWRERSRGDALVGILMFEESLDAVRHWRSSSPFAEAASTMPGDYLITMQWYAKTPEGAIFVAPPVAYGAFASGESVTNANGGVMFVTHIEAWPESARSELWQIFSVWRLFSALLQVRGTIVQDVDMPRASRRQFERIRDDTPPWITYKTLSVDLKLPGSETDKPPSGVALAHAPRGVPLHLVRAHIADYRTGKGLFGKYRGLVWRAAHRRGYQRLGVVAKTYEAAIKSPQ